MNLLLAALLSISQPKYSIGQEVLVYGQRAKVVKVQTDDLEVMAHSMIHVIMYGEDVINEPFYTIEFKEKQYEPNIIKVFPKRLDNYRKAVSKKHRTISRYEVPERAISQ